MGIPAFLVFHLSVSILRHRFLWRLRAPAGPGEVRRVERWLASTRVFLAISALIAILVDPGTIQYSPWATGLMAFYIAQSVVILWLLRRRQESTASFRLMVHAADVIWPALISVFAFRQASSFFLFLVFVLAAAAYRWGLWETIGTAMAAVCLLWIETLLFHLGLVHWLNHILAGYHLSALQVDVEGFDPNRLVMRSLYLLVMGLLLGYLAEQQKQLRAERGVITRVLSGIRVETGLAGTLQDILNDVMAMFGARGAVLASQELTSRRVFVAESFPGSLFRWLEPSPADNAAYLSPSPVETCFASRDASGRIKMNKLVGLDHQGGRVKSMPTDFLEEFAVRHQFDSLATVSFVFGHEWWGRIFLLDARLTSDTEEELRFLQELTRQIGPAVYNVYLLRRLRQRAGAVERARFARELHDGAVQSLIAVEMQVDVLKRQSFTKPALLPDELGRIQQLLREEVLKLRELMQQMKSLDVDAKRLLGFLADTVERFQRETGIPARFYSEIGELDMPQFICREVARIVQEGLVNVRKHSQARQVIVRFGANNGMWSVIIEDDGRGFAFSGRVSDEELEKIGQGPAVIRERVRLINGELTIESVPGAGARLEIRVPQRKEAAKEEAAHG